MENNLTLSKEQIYSEAFKRGFFDFITVTPKGRHLKQQEALKLLCDNITQELMYGGAAGGAKSWTGCVWLLFNCINYPNTRWFIGRNELSRIEQSTLVTFFKCAREYGINSFRHIGNQIVFANGSTIDLLELKYQPRDKLFERFGSVEYTGGWIEEGGEVHFGAFDIMKTRIGRHMNEVYNIIGKILVTANPKKNWLYTTFYLPFTKKTLEIYQKFITVLVTDNPHIDKGYKERLDGIKDPMQRKRLRDGDWDYDDDPTALCSYENIVAIFTNSHLVGGKKYLTADIARFGSDKGRIFVWDEWIVIEKLEFEISKTTDMQDAINAMRRKHQIPANNSIADEDGVGGGVVDNCKILGFVNNASPIHPKETISNPKNPIERENYFNLQTQCIYGLADVINKNGIWIKCDTTEEDKEMIASELSWIKTFKSDDERKLRILPKELVKQNIGHSPDYRDVMMMRYYFEIAQTFRPGGGVKKLM